MSKAKIEKALMAKGLNAEVEFERGACTPSGYAEGWDIIFDEESEDKLFDAGVEDCDTDFTNSLQALAWIEKLPDCTDA